MISTDNQTRLMKTGQGSTRRARYIDQVEIARYLQDAYNPKMHSSRRNSQTQPKLEKGPILESLDDVLIPPGKKSDEICRKNKIIGGMFFRDYRLDQSFPDLEKFRKEFTKDSLAFIDALWWNHLHGLHIEFRQNLVTTARFMRMRWIAISQINPEPPRNLIVAPKTKYITYVRATCNTPFLHILRITFLNRDQVKS